MNYGSVVKGIGVLLIVALSVSTAGAGEREIMAFCGSASKPAMEEAAKMFEAKTGIKVMLQFGGSGTMLSQMKLSGRGDLFVPGSPDYMAKATREGMVDPSTVKILAYLVPAIEVQSGNPKNIRSLSDLARPGLRIAIGNPESVCVGLYAVEVLERSGLLEQVEKNIVTHAHSCDAVENVLALKKVDAVIGWDVFARWNPGKMETVFLKPDEIPRLAYIPAAVSTKARDRQSALKFVEFLVSPEGQRLFSKWGYAATEKEVRRFAPKAAIGGEYVLPKDRTAK